MKKISTYQLFGEDEKILESISTVSDTGKVLNLQQYEKNHMATESHFAYDDKDRLIEMTEQTSDGRTTMIRYTLDEDDEIIATQTYYGNELYEELKVEEGETQTIKTVVRDGEVIQKFIETEHEDGTEEVLVYDESNKLIQKQLTVAYTDVTETKIFDGEDNLLGMSLELFDENEELKEKKEYDGNNNLIRLDAYTTEKGLIMKHHIKSKVEGTLMEVINTYQYDENENEISREVNTPDGQSIILESKKYNENNQIVEEIFENLSGNPGYGNTYHKIYEVEQL